MTGLLGAAGGALGQTDCELLSGGVIAQPTNTVTSLAYVVAGSWVAWSAGRQRSAAATGWFGPLTFGVLLIAIGVGSVVFHGPQPPAARALHDVPIAVALAVIGLVAALRLRPDAASVIERIGLLVVAGTAVLVATLPDVALALSAPVVAAIVVVEVVVHRRTSIAEPERPAVLRRYAAIAAILLLGGVANLLGRTGGPLCDAGSVLQLHGAWHVLTAVAFAVWAGLAYRDRPDVTNGADR